MALNPTLLGDVARDLLDCVCAALVKDGVISAECCDPDFDGFRSFVAQGEVAWDACCVPCGQVSVRMLRLFESETLPDQALGPHHCGRSLVAEWEILRLQCVTVAENAEAQPPVLPFPATIQSEAIEVLSSLYSIWTGLNCCAVGWRADHESDLDGWIIDGTLVGPEGGCVGARVVMQTMVGASCDCRDPAPPPPIP